MTEKRNVLKRDKFLIRHRHLQGDNVQPKIPQVKGWKRGKKGILSVKPVKRDHRRHRAGTRL